LNLAWIEGFAIFLAVFIVVFVGSYNDYSKEEQFFKLYALDQEGKFVSPHYGVFEQTKILVLSDGGWRDYLSEWISGCPFNIQTVIKSEK